MSRTREIDVWVYAQGKNNSMDNLANNNWANVYSPNFSGLNKSQAIKAKLIIELPERKVTISESEFYEKTCDFFRTLSGPNSDIQIAKKWQEMFFKDA